MVHWQDLVGVCKRKRGRASTAPIDGIIQIIYFPAYNQPINEKWRRIAFRVGYLPYNDSTCRILSAFESYSILQYFMPLQVSTGHFPLTSPLQKKWRSRLLNDAYMDLSLPDSILFFRELLLAFGIHRPSHHSCGSQSQWCILKGRLQLRTNDHWPSRSYLLAQQRFPGIDLAFSLHTCVIPVVPCMQSESESHPTGPVKWHFLLWHLVIGGQVEWSVQSLPK